jgi:tRNA modification GTPase
VGRSALALLRVSGKDARRVLAAAAPGLPEEPTPRHPYLLSFADETGEAIDRGLATFFPAPASATGEDVAELSVHGSPVVVERLLAALVAAGARLATPGEFTLRAFLSGKIDLVEAEAIGDLIESRTPAAARASTRRLEGKLSERLEKIREDLLAAAAHLAATIDFSEDVGEEVSPATRSHLASAQRELALLAATYEAGRLLSSGCRVALLGRPNAGKSTLFNALVGSARAIVTEVPGTTRDALEATIDVGGIPVAVVDTAGLRETEDVVERIGVQRAREAGESADAVLYVFDAAAGWSFEDAAAAASFDGRPVMLIANKIDRVSQAAGRAEPGMPLCGIAADAGEKLHALLSQTLASRVTTEAASEVLGSLRQKNLVERAREAAAASLEALSSGVSPEYAATHVDRAIDALADLVGETTSEDVLNRIFSTFCIGK